MPTIPTPTDLPSGGATPAGELRPLDPGVVPPNVGGTKGGGMFAGGTSELELAGGGPRLASAVRGTNSPGDEADCTPVAA